jgi:hypothetical protein
VVVTYVQGSPKGGDALCVRRDSNTRLGPPLFNLGEVPLVRKAILYTECVLIAVVQVAGIVSAIIGLWPAGAQTPTRSNPELVQDFMATLPPSDNMRRNASYSAETSHPFQAGAATYRIFNHKNGRAKQALLQQAQTAFTSECIAKGGAIAPREGGDYALTIDRLRPSAPEATILICIKPDRTALGMLITLKRTVRVRDPGGDLSNAALDLVFGGGAPYYLVALLPPTSVYTPERLNRETAELSAAQQQQAAERDRAADLEQLEVERWRRAIKPGSETACGPVLRVNGDLIEVVYYQTREPKWYRRSELWPRLFTKGGLRTCN